jgi:tetrapyrrole methylase family protein/MazG family protein
MKEQAYIAWRDEKMAELLSKSSYDFQDLCDIVTILRGVGGCPWDIEQDHHSIRKGMIEECYEVVEAIDRDDTALLREELGDVLLQIVFHADIENDAGHFNITDVANDECVKMIHRHPHVFGQVKADTSEQVLANWEVIKTEEKQRVSLSDQLQAIPPILPALMRAQKVGKKMNADADLSDAALIEKLNEDMKQLSDYTDPDKQKQVMGEVLFRMTTLCRRLGLEAEEALTVATEEKIKSVE